MVFSALKALVRYIGHAAGRRAGALGSLGFGCALIAKKVSANGWSAVEAASKQEPVIRPEGSTAVSKLKPSYQPRLLDQPMSARPPRSQPCPRRRFFAFANGHCRGVQGLVGTLAVSPVICARCTRPFSRCVGIEAHQPIELGAVGQGVGNASL
jgi:hypothetical protein